MILCQQQILPIKSNINNLFVNEFFTNTYCRKLFNEDVLLNRVTDLINYAVENYIKDNTAKAAKDGQSKGAQGGATVDKAH